MGEIATFLNICVFQWTLLSCPDVATLKRYGQHQNQWWRVARVMSSHG